MKTAIIIGATGLIGKALSKQLLENARYARIILLVRKPLELTHPKLKQVIYNFEQPDTEHLKADELYVCMGTTIKTAGSKEAFYKVDYTYVVTTAKTALANGTKKCAVISAMGANKNASIFYNKVKGDMEEALNTIGFEELVIVRPSLLLGKRHEFRFGELISKFLMAALAFLIPKKYKAIHDYQVAKAMIHYMNLNQTGKVIVENDTMLEVK